MRIRLYAIVMYDAFDSGDDSPLHSQMYDSPELARMAVQGLNATSDTGKLEQLSPRYFSDQRYEYTIQEVHLQTTPRDLALAEVSDLAVPA